jgi:cell division protein FtsW
MAARIRLGRSFVAEGANYYFLLGITLFLVIFGLVMVLSSSSVESFAQGRDFFADFMKQGLVAMVGLPLMLLVSRLPRRFFARLAWPALIAAVFLQLLVFTDLGWGYGGNRNWLNIGFMDIQPSEFAKVALILWLGMFLGARKDEVSAPRRAIVPVLIVSIVPIGLVLAGKDLGTAMIMGAIVLGSLFFAGVPAKHLLVLLAALVPVLLVLSQGSSSRSDRIQSWLQGCSTDYLDSCWQIMHGTWALAAGGVFGVGLGNSKAKWSWLPEADNDFIFAVIGEELGMIGAIVVVLLFVLLGVAFLRIVTQSGARGDAVGRITVAAVMIWIVSQALVNIGVILGVFPVLGVPLPLISSGGSALLASLGAIGLALAYARVSTGARA